MPALCFCFEQATMETAFVHSLLGLDQAVMGSHHHASLPNGEVQSHDTFRAMATSQLVYIHLCAPSIFSETRPKKPLKLRA